MPSLAGSCSPTCKNKSKNTCLLPLNLAEEEPLQCSWHALPRQVAMSGAPLYTVSHNLWFGCQWKILDLKWQWEWKIKTKICYIICLDITYNMLGASKTNTGRNKTNKYHCYNQWRGSCDCPNFRQTLTLTLWRCMERNEFKLAWAPQLWEKVPATLTTIIQVTGTS